MTLLQWLARPVPRLPFEWDWRPFGLPAEPTHLQLYACLIAMNGGHIDVRGWGCTSNQGPYHRSGLEQNDALCLMQMGAFVDGWLTATGGAEGRALQEAMEAEWDRVVALDAEARAAAGMPATEQPK